jgi:predicted nucleotidyltransferase
VLKWPDAQTVHQAACRWAEEVAQRHPEVLRIGYFGSYARGDWGVGSDLDVIVIIERSRQSFIRRATQWQWSAVDLPVPVEVRVYTRQEWETLRREGRLGSMAEEIVWIYDRSGSDENPRG